MKRKFKKGFTTGELLITVGIIGVLVAVAIPIFSKYTEESRENTDISNLRAAYAALVAEYTNDDTVTGEFYYDAVAGCLREKEDENDTPKTMNIELYGKGTQKNGGCSDYQFGNYTYTGASTAQDGVVAFQVVDGDVTLDSSETTNNQMNKCGWVDEDGEYIEGGKNDTVLLTPTEQWNTFYSKLAELTKTHISDNYLYFNNGWNVKVDSNGYINLNDIPGVSYIGNGRILYNNNVYAVQLMYSYDTTTMASSWGSSSSAAWAPINNYISSDGKINTKFFTKPLYGRYTYESIYFYNTVYMNSVYSNVGASYGNETTISGIENKAEYYYTHNILN